MCILMLRIKGLERLPRANLQDLMHLLSQQPYCASLSTDSSPPNGLPLPLGHPHLLPKWHVLFRAKVHLRHVFTPGKKGRYHAVWVAISFGRSSLRVRGSSCIHGAARGIRLYFLRPSRTPSWMWVQPIFLIPSCLAGP